VYGIIVLENQDGTGQPRIMTNTFTDFFFHVMVREKRLDNTKVHLVVKDLFNEGVTWKKIVIDDDYRADIKYTAANAEYSLLRKTFKQFTLITSTIVPGESWINLSV